MKHYNEEEIGQYALDKTFDKAKRDEFDTHIKECSACRELYEEMSQFYEMAVDSKLLLKSLEEEKELPSLSIKPIVTRKQRGDITSYSYFVPAKIIRFVVDRPVFVSASAFHLVVLFVFILNFKTIFKDSNPAYLKTNDNLSQIEVYNKNNEKLWEKKLFGHDANYAYEQYKHIKYTLLSDLDNDGKNEIITTLSFSDEREKKNNILQVLDYKGNLKFCKSYSVKSINFRGKDYITINGTEGILSDEFSEKGKEEILLQFHTNFSPSALFRLDNEGNIFGEYWHFGGFDATDSYVLEDENKKLVIICGYENITKRGFIAVIDPSKITGKTESSQTPGFSYTASKAELFYIALPNPKDMLESEINSWVFQTPNLNKENVFQFMWQMNRDDNHTPDFYYSFSKDMRLIDIKGGSLSEMYYHGLVEKGRIKTYSEEKLLEELKNGILYWNGKEYQKEWCRVNAN